MYINPLITRLRRDCRLNAEDGRTLHDLCRDRHNIAGGVSILQHYHPADRRLVVIEGWAARYTLLPLGERQITGLLLPGDLCDLRDAALTNADQGIIALTGMRVAYIRVQALFRLEQSSIDVSHAMAWCALAEEATLRAWIINLGQRDALQRLAYLLSELAERIAMSAPDKCGSRFFPLTQIDLADTLGLTPVHICRVLKTLRDQKMISSRRGGLTIIDLPGLRQLGGFDGSHLRPELIWTAERDAA